MSEETPKRFFWSTDMAMPADRLRLWRAHYARIFIETDIESLDGAAFSGSLHYERFGGLGIGLIASSRERYTVSTRQARQNPDGFMLDLVRSGQCYYHQGGFDRPAPLGGGMFLHTQMPSQMYSTGPSETYSIFVPNEFITQRIGDAGRLVGQLLKPDIGETHLLLAYVSAIFQSTGGLSEQARQLVAAHCTDLIIAAAGHDWPRAREAGERGRRAARHRLAREAIARRYCEPLLNGARIAATLGVSERYLQQLFEERGETISGLIQTTRLEAVRRALADAEHDHLTIAEIATSCGFSDITSFNRSYRRAFGETPSDTRRSPAGT